MPAEETWHTGRRWAAALFGVLSAANAGLLVWGLTAGDFDTTRRVLLGLLTASFALQALEELRFRVRVDAVGVHVLRPFRRRTSRWEDIDGVRSVSAEAVTPRLELVTHDGGTVVLPNSTGYVHVLRRWHGAAYRQSSTSTA